MFGSEDSMAIRNVFCDLVTGGRTAVFEMMYNHGGIEHHPVTSLPHPQAKVRILIIAGRKIQVEAIEGVEQFSAGEQEHGGTEIDLTHEVRLWRQWRGIPEVAFGDAVGPDDAS